MQDYRKLRIWAQAVALALNTRRAVSHFPRAGYGALKAQMIAAGESIVFNIVEGCGAASQLEFARFLGIAIKSAMELESQYELAHAYGAINHSEWLERSNQVVELRKQIYSLRSESSPRQSCNECTMLVGSGRTGRELADSNSGTRGVEPNDPQLDNPVPRHLSCTHPAFHLKRPGDS